MKNHASGIHVMIRSSAISALVLMMHAVTLAADSRTCRVIYPQRPQDAPRFLHLFDGSKSHTIILPRMNFSEVIDLPSGAIDLHLTLAEVSELNALPPMAPKLRIPEDVKDFYILLTPCPEPGYLPFATRIVPVPAGPSRAGKTVWCNLSGQRIVAKLGVVQLSLDAHGQTVSQPPQEASGYYEARFEAEPPGGGQLMPITEQSWWHDAQSGNLGVVFDSGGRLPRIFTFRDFRAAPEAEPAARDRGASPVVPSGGS